LNRLLCVSLFFSKTLTIKTETQPPIDTRDIIKVNDNTPKARPKSKRGFIVELSDDNDNSQINYETPKALRRKVPNSLSANESDYAGIADFNPVDNTQNDRITCRVTIGKKRTTSTSR
jgi:hypothetical protein